MLSQRASGILLHPTSLPARGGIGDLGPAAYAFLDFLAAAGQRLWQVLPLGPVDASGSPYSSTSAFAGNTLLISLERLADHGWLDTSRLAGLSAEVGPVAYPAVASSKLPLLREAAANFLARARERDLARLRRFREQNGWWLDDFVLFEVLRARHGLVAWSDWPRDLARRQPAALEQTRRELSEELDLAAVLQFFFFEQWRALHQYAGDRGIQVIGDVAIFVNHDSADVWTSPEIFHLDDGLRPSVVSGVPPDLFSKTGQRWGNPLYRWDVLKQRGYDWWVRRMGWALETCDYMRIDHFRGFAQYWEVPATEETAIHGRWVDGPGDDLFRALRDQLGDLPFIAEDLGYITPDVHALRDRWQMPGMRVLQFAFGDPGARIYLPHSFIPNCVVYTGTHDNHPMAGWWQSVATPEERRYVESYMRPGEEGVPWAFICAAQTSVARFAIAPLQDVLGLGDEARMNVPSRSEGNWRWRFQPELLTAELAARLALLAEITDRNQPLARAQQRHREALEDFAA